jgi:selenocysteine-specific elongation factor
MPLTVGTAGHIDHGKTWLVRALTGKDTDRLPEEKERGISIDLGYAPLELPGGRRLSLIDVPGHERFIRNMVAGASGIDLFLLVIDATEGAKPQTHEHLAILKLLGIHSGVVAVTKADAAEPAMVELVVDEARALVPGAEVVPVSAKTRDGLDELEAALETVAARREKSRTGETRLFVDRVFTLHGIGTVVTGTLWSGSIRTGDELRAEPAGIDVRVRSVQVHDEPVEVAEAGQRVALALPGVERTALRRGDALAKAGAFPLSYRVDVELVELEPIQEGARIHVHHGTAEIPARVVRIGKRFAQLRLAEPVLAARGDHVVLRAGTTLGGGWIMDPSPPRTPDTARLELLASDDPASVLSALVHEPVRLSDLGARAMLAPEPLAYGAEHLERAGDWYFSRIWLDQLRREVLTRLTLRAEADVLDPGLPIGEVLPATPWAEEVLPLLGVERREGKIYLPGSSASLGEREADAEALEAQLAQAGFNLTRVDDDQLARFLESTGRLIRVGDGFAIGVGAYEEARRTLLEECEHAGTITLARFRDLLGISRRPAQLLLERFDADGITRRVGDERVLRRGATIDR